MRQIKLIGLALMAMFSLTSILSTVASAEELPNILPAERPLTSKSSSGVSEFGNGLQTLKSPSSVGLLTLQTTRLGTFDILFEKVETVVGAAPCTGLITGEKEGSVLALGTFHIVDFDEFDKSGKLTLLTGVTTLLIPVHFECTGIALFVVQGCVVGALTPENTLAKTLTLTLARNSKLNDNLIITILNDKNLGEACQLLSSQAGGAFKLSTEVTTQTLKEFKNAAGTEIEVLVMRK
jgi:hypothetical protein